MKKTKSFVSLALALLLLLSLPLSFLSCGEEFPDPTEIDPEDCSSYALTRDITGHTTHRVIITVKDYGKILLLLDETTAPLTVNNFLTLAEQGFYNGLTFHRIIDGFMAQGGDPRGNGTGNPGYSIKGEFAANGVSNDICHLRGVISMARSGAPYGYTGDQTPYYNSAGCQFFIMHRTYSSLDGEYAAFGYVLAGMDIIDRLCEETPVMDNNGTVAQKYQPVIEEIRVVK